MSELASPPSGAAPPRQAGTLASDRAVTPPGTDQLRPESDSAEREVAPSRSADTPTAPTPTLPAPSPPAPAVPSGAGTLLGGRYRLHTRIGADPAAGAEFWRAEDTVLRRDVAVTVLRKPATDTRAPEDTDTHPGTTQARAMVARALRSGRFEHSGCARLLDVLVRDAASMPADVLGATVAEWVPGRGLAEVLTDGMIKPLTAARIVVPLAAAAEAAHRHGLVLGCDHPQRIRITPDGRGQLCFALPRPEVTPADDVRGLGAVLYALLTSRWPLSETDADRAGLTTAARTAYGSLPAPSELRPGVPVEIDALTEGTLGAEGTPGHVHTAATVHRLLSELVAEADRMVLFPPVHDGVPSAPDDVWQDDDGSPAPTDSRRRRKLTIGLIALGAAMAVVLGYLGVQVSSLFSEGGGPVIVVDGAPVAPSDAAPDATSGGVGAVVAVAGVEVYDNNGDRDNSGQVSRVIDGNTRTGWRTFTYRQQFPALKPGVGIMVSFASAVQLSELTIDSPSPGTVLEIRSAPSAKAAFAETVPITEVTLGDGGTPVSLANSQPVTHVLLWITKLGGGGSENITELNELQFRRAGS